MPKINTIELIVLLLANWRLASLFAHENGPKELFWRIRKMLGVEYNTKEYMYAGEKQEIIVAESDKMLGKMILCIWCNSFWIGLIQTISFGLFEDWAIWAMLPFALSSAAIYLSVRGIGKYA